MTTIRRRRVATWSATITLWLLVLSGCNQEQESPGGELSTKTSRTDESGEGPRFRDRTKESGLEFVAICGDSQIPDSCRFGNFDFDPVMLPEFYFFV